MIKKTVTISCDLCNKEHSIVVNPSINDCEKQIKTYIVDAENPNMGRNNYSENFLHFSSITVKKEEKIICIVCMADLINRIAQDKIKQAFDNLEKAIEY